MKGKWWHCMAGSPVDEPADKRSRKQADPDSPVSLEKYAVHDNAEFGDPAGKREFPEGKNVTPSLVIPWVFHELNSLKEPDNAVDVRRSLPTMSFAARNNLRAMRKAQYTVFAEALLKCWAAHREEFPHAFCDHVWNEVSALQRESVRGFQTPESLIFVEEFLAGKEFDIAKGVSVGGLCGHKLLPILFEVLTAKAQGLLGAIDSVYWTLLCPIVSGQPRSQFYPPWVDGEVYRDLRDKRMRSELEKTLKRFAEEANGTLDMRKVEAEERKMLRSLKADFQKRVPWK